MPGPRRIVATVLTVGFLAVVAACEPGRGPTMRFIATTPHQEYVRQLQQVGLDRTALGRDWIAAATEALARPVDVDAPYREARYLDPGLAVAVAYRIVLERGQLLVVRLDVGDSVRADGRYFLDLFFTPDSLTPPWPVAAADSSGRELEYVALRPGTYVLRIQPELLRGGRVFVSLSARASLGFPVAGRDMAGIRSRFGAPRDGGRREHQGVDIFAPRGTPVVAAVAGRVSRVHTSGLGGNVVWLRESGHDRRLYYAHLDRYAVAEGAWVEPGDTLGFVGNTGNARTTPPHLHFGIYMRGIGPVDPHFHLYDPPHDAEGFNGDTALVGRWARLGRAGAVVRSRPRAAAPPVDTLPGFTPIGLLAGSGRWYRARLPDGHEGYVAVPETEGLDPLDTTTVIAGSLLRWPDPGGAPMDSLSIGDTVPVLGRFGGYALVEWTGGRHGWVAGQVLGAAAPESPSLAAGTLARALSPTPPTSPPQQ
jgi:murein DD-endopeptidase MepM/ murein hydrolase activator NlpD